MEKLLLIFLYFMEESALIFFVGLGLVGYRLPFIKLITLSLAQGIIVFLVRAAYQWLEIPMGTHTIILMSTMVLLLRYAGGVKLGPAITSVLIGSSILLIGDGFLLLPHLQEIKGGIGEAFRNDILEQALYGYYSATFLVVLAVVHLVTGVKLIDLARMESRDFTKQV